ncbi:MAG: hypothetical protein KDI24_13265 [Pseudomonadales bacterium]|nr:hypothetical protein [Pseudomonadales bacterium]
MATNRMFRGKPIRRLIVSVEMETVEAIDNYLKGDKPWSMGNRSEFVRLAIEEKLRRDSDDYRTY